MIVQHPGIQPEIAIAAIPDDERVWVPQAPERLVPAAAAQHRDRQLVQPAARAQVRACCRATSIRRGSSAT